MTPTPDDLVCSVAKTEYHRLDGLETAEIYFLTALETGKSKIGVLAGLVSGRSPIAVHKGLSCQCVLVVDGAGFLWGLPIRALIPFVLPWWLRGGKESACLCLPMEGDVS